MIPNYGATDTDTEAWFDPGAGADGAVRTAEDAPTGRNGHPVRDRPGIAERYPVVDWNAAFAAQPEQVQWLVEPILERGLSYALFAPAKAGKSLLLQDLAAGLAARRNVLGNPDAGPVQVLYVDLENAITDVVERMTACGHRPDDLAGLHYLSFPALPPLDTARGGTHLAELAVHHAADLVVIDTVSRVIEGGENDADTLHDLYRHALRPLKAAGMTVVRLDHAGKDPAKGQRGSSAKATDVDAVWRLETDGPTGTTLIREAARNPHHPEQVHLVRRFEPLRHELADGPVLAVGTTDAMATLARFGVPPDAGRERCRRTLAEHGVKVSNETLSAAVRNRRTCPGQVSDK